MFLLKKTGVTVFSRFYNTFSRFYNIWVCFCG